MNKLNGEGPKQNSAQHCLQFTPVHLFCHKQVCRLFQLNTVVSELHAPSVA